MNRLALVVGAFLATFGGVWDWTIYVNGWSCAHSRIVRSCPNLEPILLFFVYPLIAIGLVLIAYSLLTSRRTNPAVVGEKA